MPDTVHWVGTGLSTGSGLRLLASSTPTVLWGRTEARAAAGAERLGLTGRVRVGALVDLDAAVSPGDAVVSMLPATEHLRLLRLCLGRGAHFANTSYTSPDIERLAGAAREAGIVVLTEAGLDPGLDHLLAHDLIARARAALGDAPVTAAFTSYCGGIPAVPNEFRYRFSWAPRGVLTALCAPARYLESGVERIAERPWEATRPLAAGEEKFEVYPNRDSLPFVAQYHIPPQWTLDTFVRGTLRLDGWHEAWRPVFAELRRGDEDRITALAADLAARYPTTPHDRDRVVLTVALTAGEWSGGYTLDMLGEESESAMARLVSTPLAAGVTDILAGRLHAGLHRAAEDPDSARRWLNFLAHQGITPKSH